MVPNGWDRKPIKELCESIIDCVNKTAKHVEHETPYKMIRTTNVRNGRVDVHNVRYVEEDTYKQWIRRGAPKDGDIIFTREAPVGEAGILENAQGIFLGQRTMMYRSHSEKSDNRFLFYSLMSGYCQKQIEDFSNGGTVAHMRVPDCGELIINTPPLPEQRKIAQILSTWDKAIATTEKLIDASNQQKKALMQQLLTGKKRLIDPETGKAFEGEWEEVKLGDVCTPQQWATISSKALLDEGYPVYGANGHIGFYSEFNHEYETVAVTCRGSTCGEVSLIPEKSYITGNAMCLDNISPSKHSYIFVYYALCKRGFTDVISGSAQPQIVGKAIKNVKFIIPALKEQQKIASVLTSADKDIELLEAKLLHFKQEKKALMQQLLTGKRRVKVAETEAA
ncbi:restriction endonuclease subunit S [Vibrio jasicida]|uniref:restriction endonuclease subunit S n=1 Tax=Vibrio jasicida TaxID=766224 RepID=UPI0003A46C37|nr:restriction endonuclease subunit S [Vibrio jasicida]